MQTTIGQARLLKIFLFLAAGATGPGAAAAGLDFDQTFHARGEPPQVHYRARYMVDGKAHTVEAWRERDERLKRRTDNRIETHLYKPPGDIEWQMVVLDLVRKIRTDIDRTNLLRIGHFTDWFSQSHALSRPIGPYMLAPLAAPPAGLKPIALCRWYALQRGDIHNHICWSEKVRLPVMITSRDGQVLWELVAFDTGLLTSADFTINDAGLMHNNANDDIKAD